MTIGKIIRLILAPLTIPMALFVFLVVYEDNNSDGKGWYQEVWKKGNIFEKIVAVIISPIVWPSIWLLRAVSADWDKVFNEH